MRSSIFVAASMALLIAASAYSQIQNGSFENGPTGAAPTNWTLTGGTALVTNAADDLFPSAGSQYCVVASTGTGPSTPGYGPHAAGSVGQITQNFARPTGAFCGFFVDWEFLPAETLPATTYNDYFSVDLVNSNTNALITNVVFCDCGHLAGTPAYTNVPGAGAGVITWVPNQSSQSATGLPAPAGFKRAWVDLSSVAIGTPMRVEITVGNAGDGSVPSRAFVDNVRLVVGERNGHGSAFGSLRVFESSHVDGVGSSYDLSGDLRADTPFTFHTCPGGHLTFRATGESNTQWALVVGTLQDVGTSFPGVGIANLNIFAPLTIPINGFDPTNPVGYFLGTLNSNGINYLDGAIPDTTPVGAAFTVQGITQDTASPSGYSLTAATVVEIGAPQMPLGNTSATGANVDDGWQTNVFTSFGAWPFYGVSKTQVFVGSNGYATFNSGDSTFGESESQMMTGQPRIALVWDDLINTAAGGGIVRTSESSNTFTVSYEHTIEYAQNGNGNNFALQLYHGVGPTPDGAFTLYYGSTTMTDGLVGISPGGLAAPAPGVSNSINLTSTGAAFGSRGTVSAGTALFEEFGYGQGGLLRDTFDLMNMTGNTARITFVPNGSGGYTYFLGTR